MQKSKNYLTEGALSKILGGAAALGAATYFGMGDLGHPEAAEALRHGVSEFGHAMLDNIGKVGHRIYNILPDTAKHTIDQIIHGDHPHNHFGHNSLGHAYNDVNFINHNNSLFDKPKINIDHFSNSKNFMDLNNNFNNSFDNQNHYNDTSTTMSNFGHPSLNTIKTAGNLTHGNKLEDILKK